MRCSTKYCRNQAAKHRKICNTCKSTNYRKNNPIRSAYHNLKNNALRRGKEFTLTFEQFKHFAIETDYLTGRGTSKDSYHIDRIDESKGYSIDNIQILTNSENVKKYLRYSEVNGKPSHFWVEKPNNESTDFKDVPF